MREYLVLSSPILGSFEPDSGVLHGLDAVRSVVQRFKFHLKNKRLKYNINRDEIYTVRLSNGRHPSRAAQCCVAAAQTMFPQSKRRRRKSGPLGFGYFPYLRRSWRGCTEVGPNGILTTLTPVKQRDENPFVVFGKGRLELRLRSQKQSPKMAFEDTCNPSVGIARFFRFTQYNSHVSD